MPTERRVAKNTLFLLGGQMAQALCTLALWLLIARLLSAEAIGRYSLAVSLSAIFTLVSKVGYENLAVREVARHRERAGAYLGDILTLKGALAVAGYILLAATVVAVGYPRGKGALILVVGAATFVFTLVAALEWCFQAFERMDYQGGLRVLRGLGNFGLGALALVVGGGILGVAVAQLVVMGLLFVLVFTLISRRFARPVWRLDWSAFASMTRQALPFGVGIVATVLLFNADTVMLSHLKGDVTTGLYNLAYRLVDGLKLLPIAFCSALYPALSHAFKNDREALTGLVVRAWYLMAISAVPVAVGTMLLADRLIVFFFGARYAAAGPVLALLVWAGALLFLFSVLSTTLAAIDRQATGAGLVLLGTGVNIALNLLFIPRWGAWGASLALVVALALVTALALLYIGRHLAISRWGSPVRYGSLAVATAVMALGLWSLRGANLALEVLAGAALYGLAIFATRGLRWADLQVLWRPVSG